MRRGDDLSNRFSVSLSPSLDIVLEENKAFAQIKNALAGNTTITFQVDVDVDCDETFYVKDKESGEVRVHECIDFSFSVLLWVVAACARVVLLSLISVQSASVAWKRLLSSDVC